MNLTNQTASNVQSVRETASAPALQCLQSPGNDALLRAKRILIFIFIMTLWAMGNELRLHCAYADPAPIKGYEMTSDVSQKLGRNISLDLRKIDVVDVLKFLSTKADLNIVTSQNVNAKVTLFLKDVTISNALDIILISANLAVREKQGVLYVMTEEEYAALYGESYRDQRRIKIIQIRYADPSKVGELIGGVKSAVGKVIIDKQTGTVVIIDTEEKVRLMETMIRKIDIPTVERVLPTETKVFELSYNKVGTLEAKVKALITDGVGSVQTDEKTNRFVVTDLPHKLRKIETLIQAFDRKTREVHIAAKIVKIILTNQYMMGVDWQYVANDTARKRFSTFDFQQTFPFNDNQITRYGRTVIGNIGNESLEATIDWLHRFGDAKTLATPQITVEDGKEASIVVGTREAYVTSTVSQADSTTTTSESITFVDVGVQLKVSPTINQDGYISMKIEPEVSSVGRTLTTANNNQIPIVDTTNASTVVTVEDGRTVMIGGLMKDEVAKDVDKVPVLGDMPMIGAAFRYTKNRTVKTEIVIFLTPQIVKGNEMHPLIPSAAGKKLVPTRNFEEIDRQLSRLKLLEGQGNPSEEPHGADR